MRARSTPPPARITGRSAEARNWRTARTSSGSGRGGAGRAVSSGVPAGSTSSRRSSGSDRSTGPGRPDERGADRVPDGRRDVRRRRGSRRRGGAARRTWSPGRSPGTPRGRGIARSTCPTRANIGLESWRAVWMPIARFAAPTARVASADRRAAGELAVGLGHERRRSLVAGADDPDAGRVEALEQAEEALAGHGERVADADGAEGVGDEPADGSGGLGFGLPARARGRRALARARARRPALGFGLGRRARASGLGGGSASGSGSRLRLRLGVGLRDRLGFEFGRRFGLRLGFAAPRPRVPAPAQPRRAQPRRPLDGHRSERHRPSGPGRASSRPPRVRSSSVSTRPVRRPWQATSPRTTTIATTIIATCANREPGITAPTGSSRTGAARPRRAREAAR